MSYFYDRANDEVHTGRLFTVTMVLIGAIVATVMFGCPGYRVWQQGREGEAELARAMQNRQIKVQEAKAQEESASLLADAEVARAKGVARANQVIGESLAMPSGEAYLRYLWITSLERSKGEVIYVPTEANLPILEAGRFGRSGAKPEAVK